MSHKSYLTNLCHYLWFDSRILYRFLLPVSWLYSGLVKLKQLVTKPALPSEVPVVVVGNLTVGGVGKTPVLICLVNELSRLGLKIGVLSRGYKSALNQYPQLVDLSQPAKLYGDEPWMIARECQVPVMIDPKRARGLQALLAQYPALDLIFSDDGLQHLALPRAYQIVVVDQRGWGNGCLLPAGPLRESLKKLSDIQHLVVNGPWPVPLANVRSELPVTQVKMQPVGLYQVRDNRLLEEKEWRQCLNEAGPVNAIAGIGSPARFFNTLDEMGIVYRSYEFSDHHSYSADDFNDFAADSIVLATEKDAVKLCEMPHDKLWYLKVRAELRPMQPLLKELLDLAKGEQS